MSIDEIKSLNVKERIILLNTIWESLEEEPSKVESPNWYKEVLEERIEKINNSKLIEFNTIN